MTTATKGEKEAVLRLTGIRAAVLGIYTLNMVFAVANGNVCSFFGWATATMMAVMLYLTEDKAQRGKGE